MREHGDGIAVDINGGCPEREAPNGLDFFVRCACVFDEYILAAHVHSNLFSGPRCSHAVLQRVARYSILPDNLSMAERQLM